MRTEMRQSLASSPLLITKSYSKKVRTVIQEEPELFFFFSFLVSNANTNRVILLGQRYINRAPDNFSGNWVFHSLKFY